MLRTTIALAAATAVLAAPAAASADDSAVTPVRIDGTCWIGDPEGNVDVPVVYVLDKRVTPGRPICN